MNGWINLLVHRSQSLSSCCFIEPLAIKSGSNIQVSYKRNEVDVFKGRSLRQCEGVQFKQIKRLKIRNLLYKEGNRPDGWQGDYIDIGFHNGTRFCDIELTETDMNFSKFDSSTYLQPFNLRLDFWKWRSWEVKVCFKP